MSYTTNPHMPRVRMEAVKLVRSGWSTRKVARYTGFNQSTIVRWVNKAPSDNRLVIPTLKPIPKHFPNKIDRHIVNKIIELRRQTNGRCSEVIYQMLINKRVRASLSGVKRTLGRNYLLKTKSP